MLFGAVILAVHLTFTFAALLDSSHRHITFDAVVDKLSAKHPKKKDDPAGKYFHESSFSEHYDGRFASRPIPELSRMKYLTHLTQTYLSTMHNLGAETWIMHGSLLGWWWNRKILPWDTDIDVMMSERSMHYLADYYNATVHHYRLPGVEEGRDYMLEINPHYANSSITDKYNVIDARWIDTSSGLFIDITTLRRDREAEAAGKEGLLMVKDNHHYRERDIFPLRESAFEDTPVRIPFAYSELLTEEYGPEALTMTSFRDHQFQVEESKWVSVGE